MSFSFMKAPVALSAFFLFLFLLLSPFASAQCDQPYDWAVWDDFTDSTSTGTITTGGGTVSVTMSANYTFNSTSSIFGYSNFSDFNGPLPPNTTTPRTTWSAGENGETTMCFSEPVANPVLLFSSLGASNQPVTLGFSHAYATVFEGNNMLYPDNHTIIGEEGYTILVFPGLHECVTIYSNTPEYYTNITWGLNPHLFEVTVTEAAGECGSATWTASGGVSYAWSGGSDPDAATNTFTESGVYLLTVTDDMGCTVVTAVEVEVGNGAPGSSTTSVSTCGPYDWNGQTYTASGTYTFETLGANGCDSIATLLLTVHGSSTSTTIASACGSFLWNGELYTQNGTYTYTTLNATGCDSTATLVLTIFSGGSSTDTVTACGSYMAPDGNVLSASGTYPILLEAANGCDSLVTLYLTIHVPGSTTELRYTCDPMDTDTVTTVHTDRFGCDSLHHIVPVLYPEELRAEAAFAVTPLHVALPDGLVNTVDLCANATGYLWEFGDGSGPVSGEAPAHTYTEPGNYTVTLVVTNELGCTDVAEVMVRVTDDALVFVPNAFTPDGDGFNEVFQPVFSPGTEVLDLRFSVFDRWGHELCTLSDPSQPWDGSFHGQQVAIGAYNWQMRYRLAGVASAQEARGVVHLIR